MRKHPFLVLALIAVLLLALGAGARAQGPTSRGGIGTQAALGTGFTYQGRLTDGGSPANGLYDFEFRCYDAATGGSQVGATVTLDDVTVTNGLFSVGLDFGAGAFQGDARWLEVAVRAGGSTGAYTTLSPRQALTPAPYALYAQRVGTHDHLGQTWVGIDNPLVISGTFSGASLDAPLVLGNSSASGRGLRVASADDGVYVRSAGSPSTSIPSSEKNGFEVEGAQGHGLYVGRADVDGVVIDSVGNDAVYVGSAGSSGLVVDSAGGRGLVVGAAGDDGVGVWRVGSPSTVALSNDKNGLEVAGAEGNGLYAGRADLDGVHVNSAGMYGVHVYSADVHGVVVSAGSAGVYVGSAGWNGVNVSSAGNDGVHVVSAGSPSTNTLSSEKNGFEVEGAAGDGLHVGRADSDGVYVDSANNGFFVSHADANGVIVDSAGSVGVNVSFVGTHGVYVHSAGSDGVHVNGAGGRAGYFNGDVEVTGSLSKGGGSFKIDHPLEPENKILRHSFVESPDMMNVYNGNVTTDAQGYAAVRLPDYFEALNTDYRYQLTVIGVFAQAIIAREVADNQFVIQTDQPRVKVSWQVTGIRTDPWAEANRIVVEEEKPAEEQGTYLHPQAYGEPEPGGLAYKEARERESERGGEVGR